MAAVSWFESRADQRQTDGPPQTGRQEQRKPYVEISRVRKKNAKAPPEFCNKCPPVTDEKFGLVAWMSFIHSVALSPSCPPIMYDPANEPFEQHEKCENRKRRPSEKAGESQRKGIESRREININPNHRVSGTTQFYMVFVEELSLLTSV